MRIPLHGKGTTEQVLDLHMAMIALNPKGFPNVPTSRKNPRYHSTKPTTRVEALAQQVYGK